MYMTSTIRVFLFLDRVTSLKFSSIQVVWCYCCWFFFNQKRKDDSDLRSVISLRPIPHLREISMGPTYFQGSQYCHLLQVTVYMPCVEICCMVFWPCSTSDNVLWKESHLWWSGTPRRSKPFMELQFLRSYDTYKHNS